MSKECGLLRPTQWWQVFVIAFIVVVLFVLAALMMLS
jgi:hypothetical protein